MKNLKFKMVERYKQKEKMQKKTKIKSRKK